MIRLLLLVSVLASVISCASTKGGSLNESDYRKWMAAHSEELTDTTTVSNIFYMLRLYPYDLDLLRIDDIQERELARKEIRSEVSSAKLLRFALRTELPVPADIYSYGADSDPAGTERAAYFAFNMNRDIRLVTKSNDTIACSSVVTERPISGYPVALFLIEFEGVEQSKIKSLIVDDRFLSRSRLVFDVNRFSTVSLPQLATNN